MPEQAPGARHTVLAATKACSHGQIVEEDNGFIGSAFKVTQPDRFVRPADADDIAIGEELEIQLGGIARAPATGGLATADVGDDVYITLADNVLVLAAVALTAGALEAAYRKVGKVTEVDASTNPDSLLINLNVVDQVAG
jgi:hypothetical protein